jgi:hypothetical protein
MLFCATEMSRRADMDLIAQAVTQPAAASQEVLA